MTVSRRLLPVCLVSLVAAVGVGSGHATAQAPVGVYLAVASPLTSEAVTRIDNTLAAKFGKLADAGAGTVGVAIFDFNPTDKPAAGANYGASYDLAAVIAKQRGRATTVAYIHDKVSGHAVLPVLACQQIIVGPKAALGEVVGPGEPSLTGVPEASYATIVGESRPTFVAVARKMFDKNVQLRQGKKGPADWFVDLRTPPGARPGVSVTDTAALAAAPDGQLGLFTGPQLRDLGLATGSADTRRELLDLFNLPAAIARDDLSGGRLPVAYRFTVRGAIDSGVKESVGRIVADAARNGATHVLLQLDAGGGDPQAARELAEKLIEVQAGESGLKVIAFVPDRAPDTAAIVALGCSEIVMSRRTKDAAEATTPAEFGDFDTQAGKQMRADNAKFWADSLHELADRQGYPALVVEGFVNPDLTVLRVHKKADARVKRFVTQAEYDADALKKDAREFDLEKQVKARGQLLKLTAEQAEEYGLARFTTESRDQAEVLTKLGLDPTKVKDATPAWLDRLADFLKNPLVTVLLVVIGFTGLILEMKVPGTTVPGIVAALCFILVFWAHTQFSGQVAVLAGLLFILGLVLVMLEVFVFPGFGVPGIVGIALMLGSLGLATLGSSDGPVPTTGAEWVRLGYKMTEYLFGMIFAVALAFTIARYLPNIPYANRMVLAPPGDGSTAEAAAMMPGAAQAAGLLGAVGVAVTVLRPAGSVRFGDDFVDVVSDGGFVPAGTRVRVVEVEGNRIVVAEV